MQEAFVEAMRTWTARGTPDRPGAWITTTARNRALDRARREARRPVKELAAGQLALGGDDRTTGAGPYGDASDDRAGDEVTPVADDQLRLMFTCCHPALAPDAQVALTPHLVCGLRTARSPGVSAARAHHLQRSSGQANIAPPLPFPVPPGGARERLPRCSVRYLVSRMLRRQRRDALVLPSCDEGMRLARCWWL